MNVRLILVAAVSILLTLAAVRVISHLLPPEKVKVFGIDDSPINIGGGSIYGDSVKGWNPNSDGASQYTSVSSTNIAYIYTDGVSKLDNDLPSLRPLKGWVILLSNRGGAHGKNDGAVKVCSSSSCDGASLDSTGTIYLSGGPVSGGQYTARWTLSGGELRFHDSDPSCDGNPGSSESPQCDFLTDVRIQGTDKNGHSFDEKDKCKKKYYDGHCEIGIGQQ